MTSHGDLLQDGIFWRHSERPPGSLRLVFLNAEPGASSSRVRDALARILETLEDLARGDVHDLDTQAARTRVESGRQFESLRVLVGFGRRLFDDAKHSPALTCEPRPEFLAYLPRSGDPFPAFPWAPGLVSGPDRGEADILLQLTAENSAAVNAAAVEVWKAIVDAGLPLVVTSSFAGFGRPDGRGWLDFHDGVSNLQGDDRAAVMEAGHDPSWMAGGTYLAFLRLAIDLQVWRRLSRAEQEVLVGRDKLSGAPLLGVTRDLTGSVRPVTAEAPLEPGEALSPDHIDPPQVTDPVVEASHVHRANQNRASGSTPGGLRMFRQGYDYLDALGPNGPELGLTFISFQRDLSVFQHLLHLPGWLADVNFGGRVDRGEGEPEPASFIKLVAGGLYAVPPRAAPFAGTTLFAA